MWEVQMGNREMGELKWEQGEWRNGGVGKWENGKMRMGGNGNGEKWKWRDKGRGKVGIGESERRKVESEQ